MKIIIINDEVAFEGKVILKTMLRKTITLLALAVLAVSCGKEKEKVAPAPAAKADKQAPPDQPAPPNQPGPPALAWSEKTLLPPGKRVGHTSFVINGKSYVFGGFDGVSLLGDLWEYDPQTDQWTQKASLPAGMERRSAASFAINGKGYIVGGLAYDLNNKLISLGDLWEYDPSSNIWKQKASLPKMQRYSAVGFAVGEKGYVTTGINWQSNTTLRDLWEYDPMANVWTEKASLPVGKERNGAVSFVLFDKAYVASGLTSGYGYRDDLWQYDPKTDAWMQMSSLPAGKGRERASCFVIGDRGYLVGGFKNSIENDVWQYDPVADLWTGKAPLPVEKSREDASGFAIDGKGYVFGGRNGSGLLDDLLEYDPTKDQ